MIFCYAQRGTLSIAAPFMIKELGLPLGVMGVVLSAFSWTYSFLQVPAGFLVDRFGARRSYALGYAFWSLWCAATGFARNVGSLIAARVLMGVGQSVAFPATARSVANWFPDRERGAVNAAYLTGVRLGQALVGAAGAPLLAAYGWHGFFLAVGLLPLVWIPPWLAFMRRWDGERSALPASSAPARNVTFLQSVALMRRRTVVGIFFGFFAYDYVWFVFVYWLPSYLMIERKFSTQEMGFYSSVPYVLMSVVIVLAGFASDWFIRRGFAEVRVRKTMIVAGFVVACLIVPAGLVKDKITAVWMLTAALCGLGISVPNTWSLTQAVCSKNIVGTVSGIMNFGGNVGGILAPALTGFIAQATRSFALALGLAGAILVMGMLAYGLLVRERVEIE